MRCGSPRSPKNSTCRSYCQAASSSPRVPKSFPPSDPRAGIGEEKVMRIAVPKETLPGERRVALVPESCKKLVGKGIAVAVESGAGDSSYFLDDVYRQAGASIEKDPGALLDSSDLTLKVQPPAIDEVARYREGSLLLCTCLPRRNIPAIHELTKRKMSVFSTDRIPRISRAQSMDTLSSMASISGYKAVLIAANALTKFFPMFMTAA